MPTGPSEEKVAHAIYNSLAKALIAVAGTQDPWEYFLSYARDLGLPAGNPTEKLIRPAYWHAIHTMIWQVQDGQPGEKPSFRWALRPKVNIEEAVASYLRNYDARRDTAAEYRPYVEHHTRRFFKELKAETLHTILSAHPEVFREQSETSRKIDTNA